MAEEQSIVEYRNIPDFPGYRAGSDGSVWSCWRHTGGIPGTSKSVMSNVWKRLRPSLHPTGYYQVGLTRSGRTTIRKVHRLILEAFVGHRPQGMCCCHGNGNKCDNRLSNLRWDTIKSNSLDAIKHEKTPRGERNCGAKVTLLQIGQIKAMVAAGHRQVDVAKMFGLHKQTVNNIIRGRTWRTELTSRVRGAHKRKLTKEQVIEIRQRLVRGERINAVAREFGVRPGTVQFIKNGTTWSSVV